MIPTLAIGSGRFILAALMLTFWGVHLAFRSAAIVDVGSAQRWPILARWYAAQRATGGRGWLLAGRAS